MGRGRESGGKKKLVWMEHWYAPGFRTSGKKVDEKNKGEIVCYSKAGRGGNDGNRNLTMLRLAARGRWGMYARKSRVEGEESGKTSPPKDQ